MCRRVRTGECRVSPTQADRLAGQGFLPSKFPIIFNESHNVQWTEVPW